MREQTEVTEQRLRALFDPDLYALPRADLALRAKELAGVLSFYIRRAVRYGLLVEAEGDAALNIAERLDDGYRLDVHRMGIVFERLGSGHHIDEDEPGFSVHRFGANKARKLFHGAMGRFDERASMRGSLRSEAFSMTERGIAALAEEPGEERLLDMLQSSLAVSPVRSNARSLSPATELRTEPRTEPLGEQTAALVGEVSVPPPPASPLVPPPSSAAASNQAEDSPR